MPRTGGKRQMPSAAGEVERIYPPGTRLRCTRNGKLYQIGVKQGRGEFWMMCETDGTRGKVAAATIQNDFERVEGR